MSDQKPTLLITSCINPPNGVPFTALLDPQLRVKLALDGISNWLENTNVDIIICDGSNFNFSKIIKDKFPASDIECLYFNNNAEKAKNLGKGYGEGEIINFALQNSTKLKISEYFIKCTAKYHVKNFNDCIKHWNNKFLCRADISFGIYTNTAFITFVDTRFFISNKFLYIEKFSQAHLSVDDNNHYYLEHAFKYIVVKEKMMGFIFPTIPKIEGVSGTSGIDAKIENSNDWLIAQSNHLAKAKKITDFIA